MKAGWQRKTLAQVCSFEKVQGLHKNLPYVGLENIESSTGLLVGDQSVQSVKSTTFRFTAQHVLYGRLRPYLNKVLLPDFEGHCSTEIFPIKPELDISREYLFYWLGRDETVQAINATATGARMPRANMNAVLDFEIAVPSLAEQKRIVAILDEAFDGIATAKANAEKNLQNARVLFVSYRDEALSPEVGWQQRSLGDLCDIKHGYAFEGEFFVPDGDYVLLTPGNFYESGGYRDRGAKQKFYAGEIPQDYVLDEGDLLVAMTEQAAGLLGSPILVPESDKFLHNQRLGLVRPKNPATWANEFFFHIFNLPVVRKTIHASASGVKVRHTSPSKIGDVVVSFPSSRSEQLRIVKLLSVVEQETQRLESLYQQKLTALAELKKSLLHEAFSGRL